MIHLLYDRKHPTEPFDARRAASLYKVIRYSYASGCTSYSCQPTNIKSMFHQIIMANKRLNDNGGKVQPSSHKKPKGTGNGTIIENKDFEVLIKQYDRPESFFYCNPPYYEAEGCCAMVFGKDDHYRIILYSSYGLWYTDAISTG